MARLAAPRGGVITDREAANVIRPQIAAGRLGVSTHPEITDQMAKQRAADLAG